MTTLARPEQILLSDVANKGMHPRYFELDGISWDTYESLVNDLNEQHVSVTYDDGRMVLMSPLPRHERIKKLAARMFETLTFECDIDICSLGSTTWKKKALKKGLEPDECYYVQHEPQVRARFDIDLTRDPPPDLAIEVDITHHPMNRMRVYGALGINEVWRFDGERFGFFKRQDNGTYAPIEFSEAIPWLTATPINEHIALFDSTDENRVIRHFVEWVRRNRQV